VIARPLEDIESKDIDFLITEEVIERKTLDYKEMLPGTTDSAKKDFLANVSSFANASGGDIIFGLRAAVTDDGKKSGAPRCVVPIQGVSPDEAKLRLESLIRESIKPRIRFELGVVSGFGEDKDGFVIVLRIPQSFTSPHMVTYKNSSRFYSRHSSGKYQLDIQELRSAFLATESQGERISQFRQNRLGKIVADETVGVIGAKQRMVLHVIPIAPFFSRSRLGPPELSRLSTSCSRFGQTHYNIDGVLNVGHDPQSGKILHYNQFFHDGSIEFLDTFFVFNDSDHPLNDKAVHYRQFEDDVLTLVDKCLLEYKALQIRSPIAISLAVFGCKGLTMWLPPRMVRFRSPIRIDRDELLTPDVVLHDLDADTSKELRPIFDSVWNACGFQKSLNYDENGNRTRA